MKKEKLCGLPIYPGEPVGRPGEPCAQVASIAITPPGEKTATWTCEWHAGQIAVMIA